MEINITPTPEVDLIVTAAEISPELVYSGNSFVITYTVSNSDTGNIVGKQWRDAIYRSTEPVWNVTAKFIKDTLLSYALSPDATYSRSVSIPVSLNDLGDEDTATWYYFVVTDDGNSIAERNAEDNNRKATKAVRATHHPYADLSVLKASSTGAAESGKLITVQWTVENKGGIEGFGGYWYDAVLFSTDTAWSDNDILAGSKLITGLLTLVAFTTRS